MGGSESHESHRAVSVVDQQKPLTTKNIKPDPNGELMKQDNDLDKAWENCCYCSKTRWGIGAVLNIDFEATAPRISQIIQGSPADEKDLRIGDMITMIDDNYISGLSLQEVYKMLRGNQVRVLVIMNVSYNFLFIFRCCDSPVLRTLLSKSSSYVQI
jgi:hypothetical protein